MRLHQRSILFPYTTLFRSIQAVAIDGSNRVIEAGSSGAFLSVRRFNADGSLDTTFGTGGTFTLGGNTGSASSIKLVGSEDRKSTRLNSSHGYISYAVFCLK